jgi:hypothetical protein
MLFLIRCYLADSFSSNRKRSQTYEGFPEHYKQLNTWIEKLGG